MSGLVFDDQVTPPLCSEVPFAICLICNDAENGGYEDEVHEGDARCSRGPAEVFVSVRRHVSQFLDGRVLRHLVVL